MLPSELILLDSDLRPIGDGLDDVAVLYCFTDKADTEDDDSQEELTFPGHDFFLRWLPDCYQARYGDLRSYWRRVRATRRNEHVKQYLLDRTNQMVGL